MGIYLSRPAPTEAEIQMALSRAEIAAMGPQDEVAWAFRCALAWVAGEGIWDDYADFTRDQPAPPVKGRKR